ncbi:TonB-dependent siderophore receptor [Achromobacter sp. Marseille-Q0513]|uniref:TonB-dependent siderophore receptor n=1 Tax=Achromobacter sp. Marseille-Q0513 TaxID=2829161 RepID=UPI001B96116D|nr:TonB-dependent siderophore receptor [Achromobacter sp. Marseille-Q0513]MBR8657354.1 TonB-dependent siderophore receptor [Achromobacter sp. Marseille-Q0513]
MPFSFDFRARLVAGALGASLIAAPAAAQQRYDLPAAPLADTLSRISLMSGRSISASAELVSGKQAAAVRAAPDAETAARQALAGTGLELVITPAGVWSLRPLPAAGPVAALEPVLVTAGNAIEPSEGTGSYTQAESGSATRMRLSLRETPQSVSVITRQQMDDQGIVNVAQALEQTPGIIVNRDNSEGYSFYSRGFQLESFQFDGLPSLSSDGGNVRDNYSITNSVVYDRIEVLKGATGLVNGAGYPSGVVNFIRKRPTQDFQGSITGGIGSWDRYRSELDLSGPLAAQGKVRGRVVAAAEKRGSYMDYARGKENLAYGIIEADLGPRTTASIGVDHQQNRNKATSNTHLPAFYSDGTPVRFPRSTNPADKWSWRNQDTTRLFADLRHTLDSGWQFKLAAAHRNYRSRELISGMSSALVDARSHSVGHGYYPGGAARFDTDTRENSVDFQASGPYTLFGRQHELVIGYNAARNHAQSNRHDGETDALIDNAFRWNNDAAKPGVYEWWLTQNMLVNQKILYGATVLRPADRYAIILGGRLSNYAWNQNLAFANGRLVNYASEVRRKFIPYAGLTYDLDSQHTVYASYTDVFKPQAYSFDANDRQLDPLTGKSMELGAKGEYLDGKLNASIALFQLKQDNMAELDTSGARRPNGDEAYVAVQGVTTRGVELEVSGEISRGWQVHAGYTYSRSRDRDGRRVSTTQPEQVFKLATTYRLPGDWHRLTVGGNLLWQGNTYFTQAIEGKDRRFIQDSYAILGLMAAYDVSKDLRLSVNLNNVFDKAYYSGIGTYNSVYYGAPRNVLAQARYRF